MKEVEQSENANEDIKENSSYSPSSSCNFADLCEEYPALKKRTNFSG